MIHTVAAVGGREPSASQGIEGIEGIEYKGTDPYSHERILPALQAVHVITDPLYR